MAFGPACFAGALESRLRKGFRHASRMLQSLRLGASGRAFSGRWPPNTCRRGKEGRNVSLHKHGHCTTVDYSTDCLRDTWRLFFWSIKPADANCLFVFYADHPTKPKIPRAFTRQIPILSGYSSISRPGQMTNSQSHSLRFCRTPRRTGRCSAPKNNATS